MFNAIPTDYIEISKSSTALALDKRNEFKRLIGGEYSPEYLVKQLDEYIIGNKAAKEALAVAVVQRAYRMLNDANLDRNNILFIGASGSGKTEIMRTLSKVLDAPLTIYDITGTTQAGYVGKSVDDIFKLVVTNVSDHLSGKVLVNKQLLKKVVDHAIIYLDEIDKIVITPDGNGRDVAGEDVQQELLKLLDNQTVTLRQSDLRSSLPLDSIQTDRLVVIAGGVFNGIEDIIEKRLNKESGGIGFTSAIKGKHDNLLSQVNFNDIIEYGFLPELVGRFSTLVVFDRLTVDSLKKILIKTKNSIIQQHVDFFNSVDIHLEFSDDALDAIAKTAHSRQTGARSLKEIVTRVLHKYYFDISRYINKKIIVTSNDIVD